MKPNKIKGEKKIIRIKFPPNATPEKIKKYEKDWKLIIKAFAKLTGEPLSEIKMFEVDEKTGKKIKDINL